MGVFYSIAFLCTLLWYPRKAQTAMYLFSKKTSFSRIRGFFLLLLDWVVGRQWMGTELFIQREACIFWMDVMINAQLMALQQKQIRQSMQTFKESDCAVPKMLKVASSRFGQLFRL